jgi:pilus assembly protein CpaF
MNNIGYQELIDDDQVENIHLHGHELVFAEYGDGTTVQKPPVASSDEQRIEDLHFVATRNGKEPRP